MKMATRFFVQGQGYQKMRGTIINKILSFQYRLGKRIGRNKARFIAMTLEKAFTTLFGREAYEDKNN